jgi:uncharacterized membrane protein (DUF2068 family)
MTQPAISTAVRPRRGAALLRIIGVFKVSKAALLIAAAIAVFHLIHKDLGDVIIEWSRQFHIAPGNKIVQDLVERVSTVTQKQFVVLGIILLAYAAMFLIEGIGLLMLKHWAEWMTVITTSGLIPLEIYEIYHKPGWTKIAATAVNVIIAVYLVVRVRREAKELRAQKALSSS